MYNHDRTALKRRAQLDCFGDEHSVPGTLSVLFRPSRPLTEQILPPMIQSRFPEEALLLKLNRHFSPQRRRGLPQGQDAEELGQQALGIDFVRRQDDSLFNLGRSRRRELGRPQVIQSVSAVREKSGLDRMDGCDGSSVSSVS